MVIIMIKIIMRKGLSKFIILKFTVTINFSKNEQGNDKLLKVPTKIHRLKIEYYLKRRRNFWRAKHKT